VVKIAGAGRKNVVAALWTVGVALVPLVFFVVTQPGANQVVGSPTRAQVIGTWGGDYGLGLVPCRTARSPPPPCRRMSELPRRSFPAGAGRC